MKFIIVKEKDKIKVKRLKSASKPMISLGGRLYRADDGLFIKDRQKSDAVVIYNIDSTQPIQTRDLGIPQDETRLFIYSSKLAGTKKAHWMNLDSNKAWKIFLAIIIVGSIAYGYLVNL